MIVDRNAISWMPQVSYVVRRIEKTAMAYSEFIGFMVRLIYYI